MPATAGTTTIEVPLPVKARLARLRAHPRQAYHEVIVQALDILEARQAGGLDPLVASRRAALRRAAKRNRVARLWLVGPRARGQARPGSDVDLLVKMEPGSSLFDLGGFYADAQEILGTGLDVADLDGLKPPVRDRVLPEAVAL